MLIFLYDEYKSRILTTISPTLAINIIYKSAFGKKFNLKSSKELCG